MPIRANKGLGIRDSKERETADVALKESLRMQEEGGKNPSQPLSRSVLRDNRALWSPSCGRHFVHVSSLFICLASLRTLASSGRAHDPLRAPLPCAAGWAGGREAAPRARRQRQRLRSPAGGRRTATLPTSADRWAKQHASCSALPGAEPPPHPVDSWILPARITVWGMNRDPRPEGLQTPLRRTGLK